MLRIAIVYNQPQLAREHPWAESEWEIVEIAQLVKHELQIPGWLPQLYEIRPDGTWQTRLRNDAPDVIFNLFEGFHPADDSEWQVPTYFESLSIPYTGNRPDTLRLCRDKAATRELLHSHGLPIAEGIVIDDVRQLDRAMSKLRNYSPWFVKPANTDASIGIDQSNVVTDSRELRQRCETLLGDYGRVLIEEFLPGREFNISIINLDTPQVLPISEIVFTPTTSYFWPIVSYEAKWETGSLADRCTRPICPANIDIDLRRELERLALRAFEITSCRHYARIDVRLDANGRPRILEVNPNPGYHPEAGFSRALQAAGWTHAEFSRALVRYARV
ncbi:MAG: hypothetical protein RMI91_01300 [Gemmatales bacterium]|nr:hypothetical protein [Gemmatales bacterium]MDW7993269.1 hypothetical protein [Gemmatales bacterium]